MKSMVIRDCYFFNYQVYNIANSTSAIIFMMHNSKIFLFSLLVLMSFCTVRLNSQNATITKVDIGVILDFGTTVGKICRTCISMALEDFYSRNNNYSTMIVPHFRDSSSDDVAAASAAIDLLKNAQVIAILGPQKSTQANFVIDIGNKVRVPILSLAPMSPALSPEESPYFIRSAWCSSSQAKAIAAIAKAFGWSEVAFIYEDTNCGSGLLPFLTENLLKTNAFVSYQSVLPLSARNDQILQELYKLKNLKTRVFVVHMLPDLASRFFQMAEQAEMIAKDYAWITTDVLTSLWDSVGSVTMEAMQGVIGVKAYVPRSDQLKNFTRRWSRRFHWENPDLDRTELNAFGLWAYDSTTGLAEAIERVGVTSPQYKDPVNRENLTDLEAIEPSNIGPLFVHLIRNFTSKWLSGEFNTTNGQLQPFAFEIVNVIGKGENRAGFWTEKYGISRKLKQDDHKAVYSTLKDNLGGIVWPGQTSDVPKGWEFPSSGNKLKVGVPARIGFTAFAKVERNAETNVTEATGFCIDVFKEVMGSLPYAVPYEFIPMEVLEDERVEDYDDAIEWISSKKQKYDVMVGDLTITANRLEFFDFTFPYTESGVATIVPVKDNERKNAWIFLKPLTMGLWLTIGAFFVLTGFAVWVLEHRLNKAFQGPLLQQVGMMFWFSFSTLVFAHREKVMSNLTRIVVIVWVFVVLVLTSSYTASLTSMLTVQRLQPTIRDINDLIKDGKYIGCQYGSFVTELLNNMKFDSSMIRKYSTVEEYDDALSKGSRNGGVAAIVDELPYIRLFLSKYCGKYTMIGPTYPTSGFGFAFPKGSPLVSDVSRAILRLKEGEEMVRISRKWFKEEENCSGTSSDGTMMSSESLDLDSFKGLFLIAGLSSSSALTIFLSAFLHENQHIITSNASIKQKLYGLCRVFYQEKDDISSTTAEERVLKLSTEIGNPRDQGRMLSQDEGFSTTESATPPNHAIEV